MRITIDQQQTLLANVNKYPNVESVLKSVIKKGDLKWDKPMYTGIENPKKYTIFKMLKDDPDWEHILQRINHLIPTSGLPDDKVKMRLTDDPFSFLAELEFQDHVRSKGFKTQMDFEFWGKKNADVAIIGERTVLVEVIAPMEAEELGIKVYNGEIVISTGNEIIERLLKIIRQKITDKKLTKSPENFPTLILVDTTYWDLDPANAGLYIEKAIAPLLRTKNVILDYFTGIIVGSAGHYWLFENAMVHDDKRLTVGNPTYDSLFEGCRLM